MDLQLLKALRSLHGLEKRREERQGDDDRQGAGQRDRSDDAEVLPPRARTLDRDDPEDVEARKECRVRDSLRMSAEEHRRPEHDSEDEASHRQTLEELIDVEKHGGEEAAHRDEREV